MAESRSREEWLHTSSILALLANVNRDPKKTPAFKPSDFDPHKQIRAGSIISELRSLCQKKGAKNVGR